MALTYVILCGGRSTRNYPHAKGIAHKCLLPFGSTRIIDHILKDILDAGGKEIVFVCQDEFGVQSFKEAFASSKKIGEKLSQNPKTEKTAEVLASTEIPDDVNIQYAIQSNPKGTTHAFGIGYKLTPGNDAVIIFPDDLYITQEGEQTHISRMKEAFERNTKQILVTGIEQEDVSNCSVLTNGRLIEKPENPANNIGGYSPIFLPKETATHMAEIAEKIERGENVPEMGNKAECIYVDAINTFMDAHENEDFTLSMFIKERTSFYMDTGNLPMYEKALLYSLLNLSKFKEENQTFLEEFLDFFAPPIYSL